MTTSELINKISEERDQARREVCFLVAHLDMMHGISTSHINVAYEYGWDCFNNYEE